MGTAEKGIQLVVKRYIIQTTHIIAVAMVIDVVSALLSQSFTVRIVKLLFFLDQHQRLLFIGVRIIISFVEILRAVAATVATLIHGMDGRR